MIDSRSLYLFAGGEHYMRLRLIGALAALLMIAPVAGFARTSTPVVQEAPAASASKTAKKKTAKKEKKPKTMHAKKKGAKKGKKEGQKGRR
jgi:uncharacterized membrane protein